MRKDKRNKSDGLIPVRIKTHKDNKGGHPHIIVDDVDDKHVSVGITHDKFKGKNNTNYALEHNPLGGDKKSYMHRQGTVAKKQEYTRPRQGKMTLKDYNRAKEYGGKAKRKYIEKRNKKK